MKLFPKINYMLCGIALLFTYVAATQGDYLNVLILSLLAVTHYWVGGIEKIDKPNRDD
jgi:hypothetical protein